MWLTNKKTGKPFNTDWAKEDANKKERQIKLAAEEAKRLGAKASYAKQHREAVAELAKDKYPDYNTYDVETKKIVSFKTGYQVTFCQIGDDYSDAEYDAKVNEFLDVTSNGRAYGGKFEGTPEISFHVPNRETAIALAKKYNQISVWDWENEEEIKTGGTGRRK